MRMKRSRIQKYHHRSKETGKDAEGAIFTQYQEAVPFNGEIWPASGEVQAKLYGEKLSYIRNVRIEGRYVITTDRAGVVHYVYPDGLDIVESDGLCLYVDGTADPDYKVIAIKPYQNLTLEAMKI